jgi:hypothetical protein
MTAPCKRPLHTQSRLAFYGSVCLALCAKLPRGPGRRRHARAAIHRFFDLAWLALPIAFLAVDMNKKGSLRCEIALLIAAWFMPAQALAARWFPFVGQWPPAVLLVVLVVLGLIVRQASVCASDAIGSA